MGSREAWGPWASSNKPAHPAAGEDARIRLWRVPPKGLQEVLTMPEAVLTGEGGLGGGWGVGRGSRGAQCHPTPQPQVTPRRSILCASTLWRLMYWPPPPTISLFGFGTSRLELSG